MAHAAHQFVTHHTRVAGGGRRRGGACGAATTEGLPPTVPAAAAAHVEQLARETEEVLRLVALLPPGVRERLEAHPELPLLLEVVLDLGRPPLARFPGGDCRLADEAVTGEDLAHAVGQLGEFGGDNRAGIDATLHRISAMRNRAGRVVGLTCRVGRAVPGSAAMVGDLVREGRSILLLGELQTLGGAGGGGAGARMPLCGRACMACHGCNHR